MIETGLVKLIQGNAGVQALAQFRGGHAATLPKDAILPNWCYTVISHDPQVTIDVNPLQIMVIQIESYGETQADANALATAIESLLSPYRGTLTDPASTYVTMITITGKLDYQNPESRQHCRMVQYEIAFSAQS